MATRPPASALPLHRVNLTELRARIARARHMDLAALTDDQVFKRIGRITHGYMTMVQHLQTNMVFRARLNAGEAAFENASELWYPPAQYVRRGRFNRANETMFYVANRFHAAIFEMRPQAGQVYTVLVARRRAPYREIKLAHIGMERCLAEEVAVGAREHLLRTHANLQRALTTQGLAAKWFAIDDYLGDLATEECPPGDEDHMYKKTNALARLLSAIPGCDGIQYPSVSTRLGAVNLCLRPAAADELFQPSEAWMLRIEEHRDELPGIVNNDRGFFGIRFISRSERLEDDGQLRWRPVGDERNAEYIFNAPAYPVPGGWRVG